MRQQGPGDVQGRTGPQGACPQDHPTPSPFLHPHSQSQLHIRPTGLLAALSVPSLPWPSCSRVSGGPWRVMRASPLSLWQPHPFVPPGLGVVPGGQWPWSLDQLFPERWSGPGLLRALAEMKQMLGSLPSSSFPQLWPRALVWRLPRETHRSELSCHGGWLAPCRRDAPSSREECSCLFTQSLTLLGL